MGIYFAEKLAKTISQLEISVRCIEDIKDTIRYSRHSTQQILSEMSTRYEMLEWLQYKNFKSESFRLGTEFKNGLGASDLEGQMRHCDMYLSRFKKLLAQTEKDKDGKFRMYVSLGALAGVAVFILLI